ncbi:penicillin acylase family protein [Xanthomonas sontii]|uniref:Penicillin acylase family protein n=1 Tax=Xanthomonas sontii TaxID=2650745 RepID=A0A6N7QAD1_9XANT|nr:penicillin acylase family protein [Xanthomonas sontii]MRH73005.1 penicillin acylase family protein [Xanthomonas sontii]
MPRTSFPLATRLLALVVLPLLLGAAWLFVSLRASLPPEGELRLTRGVSAPVTITRDTNGVPHIRAASDMDAFFAVGYTHAQDRLWQLELQRRMARGRLSEIFGKESIETDVWFRTLGLYESARSAWPALSPEAQRSLTAYSAGVNAWIAERHPLPAEFRMLGIAPERWTELDSLAWIKVFALDLGGNSRREIDRYIASQALTSAQLAAFFPSYPGDAPTTAKASSDPQRLAALATFQHQLESAYALGGRNVGSNAWVVAGRHTKDGMALLANDPHLGLQIPSLWYAISVDAPTYKVSGMSLVGLPVAVLGRNAHIAWGGTNMMADAQDLFFERSDQSGERYEVDGGWQPFRTRTETLHVRADFPQQLRKQYAPVTFKVRQTRHGPVISDYYGVFDQPVALRWTALDPGDSSYEAFFRLNYATDWASFKAALAHHVAPAMNLLYIDRDGNIGYLGAGRIPIRKQGQGTLPSAGWDSANDWSGQVPAAAWPQSYNPPSGYIVNANNKVTSDDYPYLISYDWASPARARRIEQLLRQRIDTGQRLTVGDMQHIQADTVDLEASELMDELRHRLPRGEHGAQAAEYLASWNGDMRGDSQAAAIFTVWMRHFRQRVFSPALRGSWNTPQASKILRNLQDDVSLAYIHEMLHRKDGLWCNESTAPGRETCDGQLSAAQNSALWELHKLKGDWSMSSWRWSGIQQTVYAHLPFSQSKPLRKVFERRIANGGSENTINVAGASFAGAEGYLQKFGAGFRQVIALRGQHAEHYYMNSTGQSGNVLSPHYDDMVEPFRDVRYYTLDSSFDKKGAAVAP